MEFKMNTKLIVLVIVHLLTKSIQVTAKGRGCKDQRGDCSRLKARNFCKTSRDAMQKLCPATCGVCPEGSEEKTLPPPPGICLDTIKGCEVLLARGFCQRNRKQLESRCRKTCGMCARCSDKKKDCERRKLFGLCERKQKDMVEICPATCNLCHMVKEKPKPCFDKHGEQHCQKLERLGFCETRAAMKETCTKTCRACHGMKPVSKPKTTPKPSSRPRVPGCKDVYGRVRCEYYAHIGWCDKHAKIRQKCRDTCVCNVAPTEKPKPSNCESSQYGCCWDNKTSKRDSVGNGCPDCQDDPRFVVLCERFGGDCSGKGGLAKSLNKHCSKTCNLC
uniref:ShKT domain-containing protein n=1 Tax=Clytia hemisphaerica TaxID=252671 RepID=A0A7M5XIG7_9CNID|eukprot:TCONS_00068406-protein